MSPWSRLHSLTEHFSGVLHEVTRHLLRRPVVGICTVARTRGGLILLVRRADTGQWTLPGGTLEWGEHLRDCIQREVAEEGGARVISVGPVTGVYSRPDRDWRFHAVTVCVLTEIEDEVLGPKNPLEIREARLFERADVPPVLSMGMSDALRDGLSGQPAVLE